MDFDVTKYIENENKKWDTKISGMTKAYEKEKRFLDTEKERRLRFRRISQPTTISMKLWKVFQTRYAIVKNKLVISKYFEKFRKIDKINVARKDAT